MVECFYLMIGLLAQNEQGNLMVSSNIAHNVEDIGCYKFEDEHDVISFVKIHFLILLNS